MVWVFFWPHQAVITMEYALLAPDFSVSYVAQVGGSDLPTWVQVVSLWSALEGSILLWAFQPGVYTLGMQLHIQKRFPEYESWALGTVLSVAVFFVSAASSVAEFIRSHLRINWMRCASFGVRMLGYAEEWLRAESAVAE